MSSYLSRLMNHFPSKRRWVAALSSFLFISVSLYTTNLLVEAAAKEAKTYDTQKELQILLTNLARRETGKRKFAITGNFLNLEPYPNEQKRILFSLDRLRSLTHKDDSQQEALQRLEKQIIENDLFLKKVIDTRKTKGREPALSLISSQEGKLMMDEIRVTVEGMSAHEDIELSRNLKMYRQNLMLRVLASFLLAMLFGAAIYWLIRSLSRAEYLKEDALRLERTNFGLRLSISLLERQVEEMQMIITDPITDYEPLKALISAISKEVR